MSGMLGSAKFGDYTGLDQETALGGNALVLGRPFNRTTGKIGQGFVCVAAEKHLLSIAGTRSGKGVSLIIPNLLTWGGAALVIDPKGENAWITAARRRALGQKTYILDPWDEVNLRYGDAAGSGEREPTARFNPLSILDCLNPNFADDVAGLAEATIIVTPGQGAHFDESARDLIAGLIAYTVEKPELRPEASFNLVRRYLSQSTAFLRALAEDAAELGPDSLASRKLSRFTTESRELDSVISTARTQTAFLDSPVLQKSMEASDFSFDELATGKATIYLVLPPDRLDSYARWLRLMVSIGLRTITANRRPSRLPCLFMLDELGSIGRLPALARAYSLLAGLGCVCWGFLQDLNQLKRDYPEWETFIGNCQAFTVFGVMDEFTTEHVSKMLGTSTVERVSVELARLRRRGKGGLMTDQVMSRRLMMPEEVRQLRSDVGIIIDSFQPALFHKIEYYSDPLFARKARPDPRFPARVVSAAAPASKGAGLSIPPVSALLLYALAALFGLVAVLAIYMGATVRSTAGSVAFTVVLILIAAALGWAGFHFHRRKRHRLTATAAE